MGARPHCLDEPSWEKAKPFYQADSYRVEDSGGYLVNRLAQSVALPALGAHRGASGRQSRAVYPAQFHLGYGTFFGNAVLLRLWLQQSARV